MFLKRNILPSKQPAYGILTGASGLPKNIGVSGDNYMCRRLPGGRFAAALADGMGTGAAASECSAYMLESLYRLLKIGLDCDTVMQTLNKALSQHNPDENFSTLDLAVFDLNSGICRIYKSGAAPTIAERRGATGLIRLPCTPLGILERPTYRRITFEIEHGDRYFLMSDGVSESIPPDDELIWARTLIAEHPDDRPRQIAERLIWGATLRYGQEERDDMTVVGIEIL